MTSSTPRLSEVARHLIVPEGIVTSVFPRVQRRMNEVGVSFDRWQQGFGQVCLGCRSNGRYAASVGGVVASWPRQIGKTFTVGNITMGLCLEFPGFRAIWTSHHGRTTTNTFRSMQSMVRAKKVWPHVEAIRTANGEQEIVFKNGSIIMFGAREQGFGRGMDKIDLEVFDEAQILGLKALEDMVPATNAARHPHGGLVIFIGTPPRPSDDGEAFAAKRAKALAGLTTDQVYCEISAEPGTDPEDPTKYGTFNPSYPHRTTLEAMLRMIENIPDPESRRREMLGIWDEGGASLISADTWRGLVADGPDEGVTPLALAVDQSHQREVSIAACWAVGDSLHVEEVWAGDPLAAAGWLADHARRRMPIMIDSVSPAAALVPELKRRRMRVVSTSAADMARACELFLTHVMSGKLTHGGQEALALAVAGAKSRPIRDAGGWGWDRRDQATNIAPLVSATLATLGAVQMRHPTTDEAPTRRRVRALN